MTNRFSLALIESLLAVAAAAPAADGATKYRYWQDLRLTGPYDGRVTLAVAYEDRDGDGRFEPQYAAAYDIRVQTSCDPAGALHGLSGSSASKYGFFAPPLLDGRFTHRFENQFEQPQTAPVAGEIDGTLRAKVKRHGRVKRPARVDGVFSVERWNLGGLTGCTSTGTYSATQCKRWRSKRDRPRWYREWKAPICTSDPW